MKFIKGFIFGTLVGFAAGNALTKQQRANVVLRIKEQTRPVTSAVSDNIHNVTSTVATKAADRVDAVVDTVVESIT